VAILANLTDASKVARDVIFRVACIPITEASKGYWVTSCTRLCCLLKFKWFQSLALPQGTHILLWRMKD
jgi:hypothetical protein